MKKLDKVYEIKSSRKKDFISIVAISLASVILFILIKNNFYQLEYKSIIFVYLSVLAGFISIFMGYLEARSDDPFVTGKTQTMGVINSFIVAVVAIVMSAFIFGIALSVIIVNVLLILSRELGRRSRKKLLENYIGRLGKIVEVGSKGKYLADFETERKKVYSEEKLSFGDTVKIIYLRGTYLYVEKVL